MNAALDALRERFVERCTADRAAVKAAVHAGDREQLRYLAHKLSGAAGTFGYPALSEAAAQVETTLDDGGDAPDDLLMALDRELAVVSDEAA